MLVMCLECWLEWILNYAVDGFSVVRLGERAVDAEVQGWCGAAWVPADAEEAFQEPHPAGTPARPARAATEGAQATKVRHMAVSDTLVSHFFI